MSSELLENIVKHRGTEPWAAPKRLCGLRSLETFPARKVSLGPRSAGVGGTRYSCNRHWSLQELIRFNSRVDSTIPYPSLSCLYLSADSGRAALLDSIDLSFWRRSNDTHSDERGDRTGRCHTSSHRASARGPPRHLVARESSHVTRDTLTRIPTATSATSQQSQWPTKRVELQSGRRTAVRSGPRKVYAWWCAVLP